MYYSRIDRTNINIVSILSNQNINFFSIIFYMLDIKRVRKLINWLIFTDVAANDNELSSLLGYTKSSFSQIVNGKVPVSEKSIRNRY